MDSLISIQHTASETYTSGFDSPYYQIMLFEGVGSFEVDFTRYSFKSHTILFLSPYQHLKWSTDCDIDIYQLQFHGDFYCIEYHKKEVACNGLLFNNIYLHPHLPLSYPSFEEITAIFDKLELEVKDTHIYADSVLRAYLQLILALCSKEKKTILASQAHPINVPTDMDQFQQLLEQNFIQQRSVAHYADQLALSTDAFSKKIKKQFGKTPSQLIQDRVVLEAKKRLHLTFKSIKQIASELHFEDEFYFSRYFKKCVGLSPAHYREQVGISVVAK